MEMHAHVTTVRLGTGEFSDSRTVTGAGPVENGVLLLFGTGRDKQKSGTRVCGHARIQLYHTREFEFWSFWGDRASLLLWRIPAVARKDDYSEEDSKADVDENQDTIESSAPLHCGEVYWVVAFCKVP